MNKIKSAVSFGVCAVLGVIVLAGARPKAIGIGEKVPELKLADAKGKKHSIFDGVGKGEILVVGFYSPRCPINKAFWERLGAVSADYKGKGVKFVGINSNLKEPLAEVKDAGVKAGISGSFLRDEGDYAADKLGAIATPHMFVIDSGRVLRYRGAVDDSGGNKSEPKARHLREALDAVLAGKPVAQPEPDSFIG